jgi:hypothetical protein
VSEPLSVIDLLTEVSDHAGAFLWRRVARDLDGPLRVALLARDESTLRLATAALDGLSAELVVVPLHDDDPDTTALGRTDRLLGCHAAVAVTPYANALGAAERDQLEALDPLALPAARRVALVGRGLLERLSDEPEREARQVRERVEQLAPDGWPADDIEAVRAWLEASGPERREWAQAQRRQVARLLLRDAHRHRTEQAARARDELASIDALLDAEDAALDEARRAGRRTAAHVLGAVRRETERLLVDLRDFLLALEADLPSQLEAVGDLPTLRRTVPHWLQHVVEGWLTERLERWRADVTADVAEVGLSDEDAAHAELLVPALFPAPVASEGSWGARIGATVGLGGGAALALAGLWLPALIAATGGLAWGALGREARVAESQRKLLDASVKAVRGMGDDAERLLRDQIRYVELELDQLGEERAAEVAAARDDVRRGLSDKRAARLAELERLDQLATRLADALGAAP